jgi:hypothetical protein
MKHRTRIWIAIALPLAVLSTASFLLFEAHERRLHDAALRLTETISYDCSSELRAADREPPVIGATELILTEHRAESAASRWTVRVPGSDPVAASTFPANTGSIGGSHGLRWRAGDGRTTSAILSFNDIVDRYGPITITLSMGDRMLVCVPDPASYRGA